MTIVEALGGANGQTIVEVLGGQKGQTVSDVIVEKGYEPIPDEDESFPKTFSFIDDSGTYVIDPTSDFNSTSDFLAFCEEHAEQRDERISNISDNYVLILDNDRPQITWIYPGTYIEGNEYWMWYSDSGHVLEVFDDHISITIDE